jgi:type IV secretion system protein VirB9
MTRKISMPPLDTCGMLLAALGLISSSVQAEIVPTPGLADSRIRTAAYRIDEVYRLRGFVGYQIDLEFEPGETFVGLGAGDIEGLSYFGQDNHLFLKPKAVQVTTNLTVLTNRRRYQIDYTATPQRPGSGDQDVVYAVKFTYPASTVQSAAEAASKRIDAALKDASTTRPQNIDYWYCGNAALRPTAASDDGVHTRLRFAVDGDLPAIFVRNADGTESLLNFSMDGGDVIVHRVAQRYILRRGKLTGCIVNQGFSGGSLRLDSGTVTPEVERKVQAGAAP